MIDEPKTNWAALGWLALYGALVLLLWSLLFGAVRAQDTLSQHNTLHKAIEAQAQFYGQGQPFRNFTLTRDIDSRFYVVRTLDGDIEIQQSQTYRIEAEFIHPPNLRDVYHQIEETLTDTSGSYLMTVSGSTGATSLRVATNCYGRHVDTDQLINERRSHSAAIDSTGAFTWQSAPMYCAGIMTYWVTADGQTRVEFIDIGQLLSIQ